MYEEKRHRLSEEERQKIEETCKIAIMEQMQRIAKQEPFEAMLS